MPEYAIEICGPQNECAAFAPAGVQRVRGRWDFVKVSHRDIGEVMKTLSKATPTIPGQYIVLDTEKREAAIVDPLRETSEGVAVMAKINAVYAQFQSSMGGATGAKESQFFRELDFDAVKTWGAEMAKLVAAGLAVNVPGYTALPKLDEIRAKWPGKRKADPFNSGRKENSLQEYVDSVPVGKAAKLETVNQ